MIQDAMLLAFHQKFYIAPVQTDRLEKKKQILKVVAEKDWNILPFINRKARIAYRKQKLNSPFRAQYKNSFIQLQFHNWKLAVLRPESFECSLLETQANGCPHSRGNSQSMHLHFMKWFGLIRTVSGIQRFLPSLNKTSKERQLSKQLRQRPGEALIYIRGLPAWIIDKELKQDII